MVKVTFADYVKLIYTMFDLFVQSQKAHTGRGRPFLYKHQVLIVFFTIMQCSRIFQFKTQHRWLEAHCEKREQIGLNGIPHRTTLSRRYKRLYQVIQEFIAFLGQYTPGLATDFENDDLYEDKSLFKAQGPVWHQADRQVGYVPEGLRHLDRDATWSKSEYHGWVYGYGLHLTTNYAGFPELAQVETAAVSESQVMGDKKEQIIHSLCPDTLTGDNSYTQASRIRNWAKQGVALLSPAVKWVKGHYARSYHNFIKEPENASLLQHRRTAIEPMFDLVAQVIGATNNHKQLSIQRLVNVRTCLALAVLTVQIAMIANSIWELPLRNISTMMAAFT